LNYLRFDFTTFRSARWFFQLGGPFGFCAFALLSPRTAWLSGNRFEAYSSSSAYLYVERYSMTEGKKSQGWILKDEGGRMKAQGKKWMNAQLVVVADRQAETRAW